MGRSFTEQLKSLPSLALSMCCFTWRAIRIALGQLPQTELARVLGNKKDLWFFHSAKKVKELSNDDRDLWLGWLSELRLGTAE